MKPILLNTILAAAWLLGSPGIVLAGPIEQTDKDGDKIFSTMTGSGPRTGDGPCVTAAFPYPSEVRESDSAARPPSSRGYVCGDGCT